jgi:hypothetical protein
MWMDTDFGYTGGEDGDQGDLVLEEIGRVRCLACAERDSPAVWEIERFLVGTGPCQICHGALQGK